MIKVAFDHAAQVLYNLRNDPEISSVKSLANEKEYLYRAVYHDYKCQSIMEDRKDFFEEQKYYEKDMTRISLEVQLGGGLAEQNMILYHVNTIIDGVARQFHQWRQTENYYYNIGFIGLDLNKKQLFITDIEARNCVYYQILIDRDINHVNGIQNEFQYFIRFRFAKREQEE